MILDTVEEIVEERSELRWGLGARVEATSVSVSRKTVHSNIVFLRGFSIFMCISVLVIL